jgi:hypothetical protein
MRPTLTVLWCCVTTIGLRDVWSRREDLSDVGIEQSLPELARGYHALIPVIVALVYDKDISMSKI